METGATSVLLEQPRSPLLLQSPRSASKLALGAKNQFRLELVQRQLKAGRIFMRIVESLDARMQAGQLLLRAGTDGVQGRRIVNRFAVAKDRHEQVLVF